MSQKKKKQDDKHLWLPDVIGFCIELIIYAPRLLVRIVKGIFTN
ncbi:hypothetical protein N0O92_16985 [Alkalihalobacillus sp. MEB130]|nr:hypothetical protein [Alkalihalobacillus sp. MEB130]MDT8861905.1 hypothetical protein [Alkalihalobacillus sp. MEB130]